MAAKEWISPDPDSLESELQDLRQGMLVSFLLPLFAMPMAWYAYVRSVGYVFGPVDLAALQFAPAVALSLRLRRKHYAMACWIYILSLILALGLATYAHPQSLVMALGTLVIISAFALLGSKEAVLVMGLTWLAIITSTHLAMGGIWPPQMLAILALYALVWGTTWLTTRPLRTSVCWALTAWEHARRSLAEAQERRAELYRALRALEEATYRIEHMNHELVLARREAERARAQKARFATTVSHEIRGPLSLILGFSRLMALSPEHYGESLPAPYYADIDAIYRNAQHLAALVDDILDLSQIEAERLPLVKDWIDLAEDVCVKAVDIIRPLAERQGLFLRLEAPQELPRVVADPVRLRQVLLNLLTNAIRLTERGGIVVRVLLENEQIVIAVQDTGPGIAPQDLPTLFEEFRQLRPQANKGSGLGLSISKHLVELHGGHMWAESQQGVGTTFYLTVPLPGSQPLKPQWMSSPALDRGGDHPGTCLVVGMEPSVVRVLARYLEDYRVIALPDPEDVHRLTAQLYPRAILAPTSVAPVLVSTLGEYASQVPIITCDASKACLAPDDRHLLGYLIKPVAPEALATIMARFAIEDELEVLLVDDDPDAVRLLENMLMSLPRPYRIKRAYNAEQALALMREERPDVLILDLIMPDMDGQRLIAHMRQEAALQDVPVIVVSAQDPSETKLHIGQELKLYAPYPIEVAQAARCLRALLAHVGPSYPEISKPAARPQVEYIPRSVSATPPKPPETAPATAD